MSDGPHKTLPMRRRWKALVRCADQPAYSDGDVAAHVCPALAADWIAEVPEATIKIVGQILGCEGQTRLFVKDPTELENLRRTAGSPFEAQFIDAARDVCDDGLVGRAALAKAIENAWLDRAVREALSAQEHYLRETYQQRASKMGSRLEGGICAAASMIKDQAIAIADGGKANQRRPRKQNDLEDGVPL